MKRFVISLFLLAIIAATYIAELSIIDKKYDSVSREIKLIELSAEQNDFDEMKNGAEKLSKKWKKDETVFTLFINHSSVDEITCSISRLGALSTEETAAEFRSELECIKAGLHHIRENEKPQITNVF